jgi:hypothetical protein
MAKTVHQLAEEINKELERLAAFDKDKAELIAQIDALLDDANATAGRERNPELMNKASLLTYRIAHVLDTSSEDTGELNAVLAEVLNERTMALGALDENPDTIATLERILVKAKYSNEVANTLRDSLKTILEEAKSLKKPSLSS